MNLDQKIAHLQGPILILGGSGFIGANLFRMILARRSDVYATAQRFPAWRLEGLPDKNIIAADLLVDANLSQLFDTVNPRTVFDCTAFGAYSFETDRALIYRTNFNLPGKILELLEPRRIAAYVHAGSSSEYGDRADGPDENSLPEPNSDYSISKIAAANLIHFFGKKKKMPAVNLRLYSVYGPYEDSSRLVPKLVQLGLEKKYPPFVDPDISRDFIYVDDACEAFIDSATNLAEEDYGESFNIGSGKKTTIRDAALAAREVFGIADEPRFQSMPARHWDVSNWFARTDKARTRLGWQARTDFREGLRLTAKWYENLADKERYLKSSKQFGLDTNFSVSAIIACYKDEQAIPIMYDRLKKVFDELRIDYEIIFVNDCSPDQSEEAIRAISARDRRVTGISHSRNFGSQAAFRSGMEIATKNACVLLDGDLQDPPELIAKFVEKWREGYEVVYGRRVKRQAPLHMQIAYKTFYRLFDKFSYLSIPRDAGDFSLMDKKVVRSMLTFPERDLFLRGVRAFVGFKQTGVDYVRPERMFGRSTNNLFKNIGWAKKGLLSFTNTPLNILSFFGVILFIISIILGLGQLVMKLVFPGSAPAGLTTVILAIFFFGSVNLFGLSIIGEYIAKIFEEVKSRPHFIRKGIIRNGEIRQAINTPTRQDSTR